MTEEDAADVYEYLAQAIETSDLRWVLGQVEEFVQEGKTAPPPPRMSQRLRKDRSASAETVRLAVIEQTVKGEFRRTNLYTHRERLTLLIEALEEVLGTIPAMRSEAADTLRHRGAMEVRFVPELDRREEVSLTAAASPERLQSAKKLSELLRTVKAEL